MAAIADIQITPPVLKLDPATRTGRFSATVANQLGREGRLEVSLILVGETKEEWLHLEERYQTLSLKKDETAVFDVAVSVPPGVAPGTYSFKLRCADALDPANVKVDSEQRDLVVAPRGPAPPQPPPPAGLRWVLIGAGALILIGGGITLAIVLTKAKCDPACQAGFVCKGGKCEAVAVPVVDAASPPKADAAGPHPDGACAEGFGSSCGPCKGTLQCNGTCTKPTPDRYGQKCNECGGKIDCDGCAPAAPANYGTACNQCGGHVQCNGTCAPAQPPDLNQVKEKFVVRIHSVGERSIGGACDKGYEVDNIWVRMTLGMKCQIVSKGQKQSCTAQVASSGAIPGGVCEVVINERRVCDTGNFQLRLDRAVEKVLRP